MARTDKDGHSDSVTEYTVMVNGKPEKRFKSRYRRKDRQTGKRWDLKASDFLTRENARAWWFEMHDRIKRGQTGEIEYQRKAQAKETLRDVLANFLVSRDFRDLRPSTQVRYREIIVGGKQEDGGLIHREAKLCGNTLNQLNKTTWRLYRNKREHDGVCHATIKKELVAIRSAFKWWREENDSEFNPFSGFKIGREKNEATRILELHEDVKLYQAIEQITDPLVARRWRLLVNMALTTCLRGLVLFNLKWQDIDWENGWINIREEYCSPLKNAPEQMPLDDVLCGELWEYYQHLPDTAVMLIKGHRQNVALRLPHSLIFPGTESAYKTMWQRIRERAGLFTILVKDGQEVKQWQGFHGLRHTGSTRYRKRPLPLTPDEIDYLMGHIDGVHKVKGRISDTYNHEDYRDRIQEQMNKRRALAAEELEKRTDKEAEIVPDKLEVVMPQSPDTVLRMRLLMQDFAKKHPDNADVQAFSKHFLEEQFTWKDAEKFHKRKR